MTILYTKLENLSFKDQVRMFYDADIVLSPHGSGLVNVMFCLPHSALVECTPPYFYELWYINTASLSSVHYIGISTYMTNKSAEPWITAEKAYQEGRFEGIRKKYLNLNVNPPLISVINALRDSIGYISRWRFVFESQKKWSSIFY